LIGFYGFQTNKVQSLGTISFDRNCVDKIRAEEIGAEKSTEDKTGEES
jgi:hypothetical protein